MKRVASRYLSLFAFAMIGLGIAVSLDGLGLMGRPTGSAGGGALVAGIALLAFGVALAVAASRGDSRE